MKKDLGINMTTKNKKDISRELPTLDQVFLVEDVLLKMDDSLISLDQLKKKIPRKLKGATLITILDYLESMNKITITPRGITWIHNTSLGLRKASDKGLCL